ncbi:MAG TPA: hypothetical protein EYP08_07995 [Pyrodictiaceae archaeon]|nr:hypothetical protein [Pyrodictiaceae archaeon]HIQ56312.1 hypothetical protein [Pyrodictium sp.]
MTPADILYIAFLLSVIGYQLGALLQALPVPMRWAKKWAPILMSDSVLVAFLIFAYNILFKISDYIVYMLELDVGASTEMLAEIVGIMGTLITAIKAIVNILPPPFSSILSAFFQPLIALSNATIFSALFLLTMAVIAIEYKYMLTAVAVLLYAIPFRLGRSLAASFLAFVIVVPIAVGLLPSWLSLFKSEEYTSLPHLAPVAGLWGQVVGAYGTGDHGILRIVCGNITYTLVVGVDGVYVVSRSKYGLPMYTTCFLAFNHLSENIRVVPSRFIIPFDVDVELRYPDVDYRLDIYAPRTIFLRDNAHITLDFCAIANASLNNSMLTIQCFPLSQEVHLYLFIRPQCIKHVSVSADFVDTIDVVYLGKTSWYGVDVAKYLITIKTMASEISVYLKFKRCECVPQKPHIEVSFAEYVQYVVDEIIQYLMMLLWDQVKLLIALASYATLTVAAIYSVARVIGASHPRLVIQP